MEPKPPVEARLREDIAEIFLRYQACQREADAWSLAAVDDLVRADPEAAWELICVLIAKAPSDEALAYVAAGPLEDLLKSSSGLFLMDRIEEKARKQERIHRALSGVWMQPTDPTWERWMAMMTRWGYHDGRRTPL